ncbi:MAG: hypothetical protein GXC76_05600 [Rhodanobacteraceae bacterium]|jgi:uncharacterized delta-60 repeat protein|nr:hypothetical protein [Rhodanobacteraceae bacterium]
MFIDDGAASGGAVRGIFMHHYDDHQRLPSGHHLPTTAAHAGAAACHRRGAATRWLALAWLLLALCAAPVFAQSAADGFDPVADDAVTTLAVQADGKVLVGGVFTRIGGQVRQRIARLQADGSLDGSFDPAANDSVDALAVQADGKVLLGGLFTQVGGQARRHIARLHADGTLDAGFDPVANGWVLGVAVQADGKVLIGGDFTQVGGQPRNRIARLNADGTLDADFDPGANGAVTRFAVLPGGKLLVGGMFTQIGGQARQRLARLNPDGTLDAGFSADADDQVRSLAVQVDGKVLVGGDFTQLGGQARNRIARLNADGTLDAGFDPGAGNKVYGLAVQADGKVLVGGTFTQLGGQPRSRLARLDADGTLDAGFDPGADASVFGVAVQPDGKVLAGGLFRQLGGRARHHLARVEVGGTLDADFDPGANASVFGMAVQPDGKVLLGGDFTQIGGQARQRLARLNADGTPDAGFDPGANAAILSLAVQPDGKVLAGGTFTQIAGQPRGRLARLHADGTLDGFDPGVDDRVETLVVQPDGKVLIGGRFTRVAGQARNRIARLNADGTLDAGFRPLVDYGVASLAVQPDGKVLLVGQFTRVGGQVRPYIARLDADGTLDAGFNPGANDWVYAVAVQPDGKIVVAGEFTRIGGQARSRIARLNADGTVDADFDGGGADDAIHGLALQVDGKLMIGGMFTQVAGQARLRIARLKADGTLDAGFDAGANGAVYGLTVQPDGKVLAGGAFTQVGGRARANLARLASPEAALQSVAVDRASVRWLRSGGGPQLHDVWFERSAGDGTWSALGRATRIADGWLLDGVSLPRNQAFWLRARGVAASGYINGSASLIEAVRMAHLASPVVTATVYAGQGSVTPAQQDVEPGADARFTVTPAAGWYVAAVNGDTCTPVDEGDGSWRATDIQASCAVRVTFAQNALPVALPQSVSVPFNTAQPIALAGNDPNPGGPFALTYAIAMSPGHGTVSGFDPRTGTLTYTPVLGYSGADSFTFTVTSANGTSAPATVSLTIAASQAVEATPQSVSVPFNTAQPIVLAGHDPNPGGPFALTYAIATSPVHGTVSGLDASTGTLTYTPVLGYSGADSFAFTVTSANGTSAPATVSLTIAAGLPIEVTPQGVSVPFNTATAITLAGHDPNPGGPFAFTYAIATPPTHGTVSSFDASTGTLTYTPAPGYSGTDGFTFTATTVNGTSQPGRVDVIVTKPQLVLAIADGRDHARYGQIVDYVVTLTNAGGPASAVPVVFTLSSGFDGDYARLACFGAGVGATCVQDAADPLRFTATLPADRSLTWLVSVPVRHDADEASVEFGVSATGAAPVVDSNTLVVFRDGFDVPYGDGTQRVVEGAQAKAILEGDALRAIEVPASLPATTTPLLRVREGLREVRVEGRHVAGIDLVRLLERALDGRERASVWSATQAGAVLVLGSVATPVAPGASAEARPRALVLDGAQAPLVLH